MDSSKPVASADGVEAGGLAKAFQELAKGERTAAALENQLSSMEAKIEALLAQAEKDQEEIQRTRSRRSDSSSGDAVQGAEKAEEQ
ncbi:hypothetical protein LTR53_000758 [Teratosphaeriaceae sp. CCFEE 6253]|nr:hypothetical protein LTR53_000758 [Teratosphaeriaceae sp. CCFEE 6253]